MVMNFKLLFNYIRKESVLFSFYFIEVQLIDNIMLLSCVQQSDSVAHMHIFILLQILFSYRLSQNTEWSFLCYKQLLIDYLSYIQQCVYSSAAAAKSLQSRPTLCDPIDGSPPGSPVPGILQARTLEWVAISFSNA